MGNTAEVKKTWQWSLLVIIISLLCYIPTLSEQNGFAPPAILLNAKNLFVIIPLFFSLLFIRSPSKAKQWFKSMFRHDKMGTSLLLCLAVPAVGLAVSYTYYNAVGNAAAFYAMYTGFAAVLGQAAYLFITGLAEEMAWRGYLFNHVEHAYHGGLIQSSLLVGIVWGVWHIPMWAIRNALGPVDILLYLVWTLLLSIVLCFVYKRSGNILLTALLHMGFNMCYTAGMPVNIAVLAPVVLVGFFLGRRHMI